MYFSFQPSGLGRIAARRPRIHNLMPVGFRPRGMAGLGTLSFPQVMVAVPQPSPLPPTSMPTAETEVANAAAQLANDPTVTAQDLPNLAAITASLIAFARTRCNNSWAPYTCAGGFDPVAIGTKYANLVWAALQSDISAVSGKPNYNPAPGAVPPTYGAPAVQAPFNPASVPGSSVLPPPPSSPPPTFTPAPAPGMTYTPGQTLPTPSTPLGSGAGVSMQPPQVPGMTYTAPSSSTPAFNLQNFVSSNWLWLAGGAAALYFMSSSGGGRSR